MQSLNRQMSKPDVRIGTVSLVGIFLIIFMTNPASLHAVFLLSLPILCGLLAWSVVRIVFRLLTDLSSRHVSLISMLSGVGALTILALGSMHQLGFQDVILTLLLLGGLAFYGLGSMSRYSQT